jgi:hypothetical protein
VIGFGWIAISKRKKVSVSQRCSSDCFILGKRGDRKPWSKKGDYKLTVAYYKNLIGVSCCMHTGGHAHRPG